MHTEATKSTQEQFATPLQTEEAKSARVKESHCSISLAVITTGAITAIAGAIIIIFLGFTYNSPTSSGVSSGSWTPYAYEITGTTTLFPAGLATLIIGILLVISGIAFVGSMLRRGELNESLELDILGSIFTRAIFFGIILIISSAFVIGTHLGYTYEYYWVDGTDMSYLYEKMSGTSAIYPFSLLALITGLMLLIGGIAGIFMYRQGWIGIKRVEQKLRDRHRG